MDKYFPLVYLLLSFVAICQSLPGGAPRSVCDSPTLTPQHPPNEPQLGPAPYEIRATQLDDGKVAVLILSTTTKLFKGFVINALDDTNKITGIFHNAPNTIDCVNTKDTATHSYNVTKFAVHLEWRPTISGPVTFRATVVERYDTFYIEIKSKTINPSTPS